MKENVTGVALLAANVSLVIIAQILAFRQIIEAKNKKLTGEPEGPEVPRGPIGP